MAGPLQVFMVRMWVSLWNAPSRPLLHVSTWLILTCSSLYAPEPNHRENLAAVKGIQEFGLKSAHTFLLLLRCSSSFLFCVLVCSAYQRSHLFCEKHRLRFSRVMRQFLFCSASLQIDFSGATACRLIIQRDLDSCMTRRRLDTRKPHVFLSFGGGAVALQRYSCQPLPLVINQFPANKELILLFKIPPTPSFFIVEAVRKSLQEWDWGGREKRKVKEKWGKK